MKIVIASFVMILSLLYIAFSERMATNPLLSFSAFASSSAALYWLVCHALVSEAKEWKKYAFICVLGGVIIRLCFWNYGLSDDVNRYAWEGLVASQGVNPYVTAPADLAGSYLSDSIFAGINHKDVSTVYPPVSMTIFRFLSSISYSLTTYKVFAIILDSLIVFLVCFLVRQMKKPPHFALLYAFSPLVLVYIAGEGHLDVIHLFFLVVAFICFNVKDNKTAAITAMTALGCAVMSKYLSIVFLPFLMRREHWKYCLFFLMPFALLLIYRDPAMFDGLIKFSSAMAYNDVFPKLLRLVAHGPFYSFLMLAVCGGGLAAIWLICQNNRYQGCMYAYLWLLLCLPSVHAWYLLPLVVLATIFMNRSALTFCLTIGFGVWVLHHQLMHGEWKEFVWIWCATYVPLFVVGVYDLFSHRRSWYRQNESFQSLDIVVPVYNERCTIDPFLIALTTAVNDLKSRVKISVTFCDGGSTDETVEYLLSLGQKVIISPDRGRGNQIHYAVTKGQGDVVLILHADALINSDALELLVSSLRKSSAQWGILGHYYDTRSIKMRIVEIMNVVRFRMCGLAFGDQGMFVRRSCLTGDSEVPALPLMEDVEMSLRFLEHPRLCLGRNLTVSARRWNSISGMRYTIIVLQFVLYYLISRRFTASLADVSDKLFKKYYS